MSRARRSDWLPLGSGDWQDTQIGLHLRTQIVGKTRLALAPMQNHWWHSAPITRAPGSPDAARPHTLVDCRTWQTT